jgi:hypothetical protein
MAETVGISTQTTRVLAPGSQAGGGDGTSRVPAFAVVAVVASFAAAWTASGSVGLLGHALRHALTWVAMGVALAAVLPVSATSMSRVTAILGAALLVILTTPSIIPAVNVMGVAGGVAILAMCIDADADRVAARALRVAAAALGVFAVFRLAAQAAPIVWSWADNLGQLMGWAAGKLTGHDLSVGVTFGGVDLVVLTGSFYAMWLATSPAPRWRRAIWGAAGIVAAQLVYLAVLSFVPTILADVPEGTKELPNPEWVIPVPLFVDTTLKLDATTVRQWLPWKVPMLGVALHALALVGMMRWGAWRPIEAATPRPRYVRPNWTPLLVPPVALAVVALALGLSATFCSPARSLEGKKIVVYNRVFGNYMKPKHDDYGQLTVGMYGNLKPFVESLGGRCVIANQLTDDVMRDADALLVIYPAKPYASKELLQEVEPADLDDPRNLFVPDLEGILRFCDRFLHGSVVETIEDLHVRRVWDFVDKGGSLLVVGEHTISDDYVPPHKERNYFNRLLAPTKMRVAFDSATFEIGGWLQSYHAMFHPTTAGIEDGRNPFGVVIGASVEYSFPARPILLGRWGYNDPGDVAGSAMMGNHKYDPGERLGDVVLAAEQGHGKGNVVVFGDTSTLTNGITVGTHAYNARLLAYLANAGGSPVSTGRQVLTILLMVLAGLLVLVAGCASRPDPGQARGYMGMLLRDPGVVAPGGVLVAMVCLAFCVSVTSAAVGSSAVVYPNANRVRSAPAKIAYIDNAHLGFYSEESWRQEGTMGLAMTLMRSGYLTYFAPDLSLKRLLTDDGKALRANLVVMPAPTKALTTREIDELKEWVRKGGKLVMTIGWDRYRPNRELLNAFGFDVGGSANPNLPPEPLGHFKAPYYYPEDKSYQAYVRFHSAWLVRLLDPSELKRGDSQDRILAREVAFGRGDETTIVWRREGDGQVVLIGDSEFATNKNLEREDGTPFEGMRENAHFWRWFLTYLENPYEPQKWWTPPNPAPEKKEATPASSPADAFDLDAPSSVGIPSLKGGPQP